MSPIEKFVEAVQEGRPADAIKQYKAVLDEQREAAELKVRDQVVEEFGFKKAEGEAPKQTQESEEDDEHIEEGKGEKELEAKLKKMGGTEVVVNPGYFQAKFDSKEKANSLKDKLDLKGIEVNKDPGGEGYFVVYNNTGKAGW